MGCGGGSTASARVRVSVDPQILTSPSTGPKLNALAILIVLFVTVAVIVISLALRGGDGRTH